MLPPRPFKSATRAPPNSAESTVVLSARRHCGILQTKQSGLLLSDEWRVSGCSISSSSKAAASEEVRRTLRYVEPLSDARTQLADLLNSPLRPILRRFHIAIQQVTSGKNSDQLVVPDHRHASQIAVLE